MNPDPSIELEHCRQIALRLGANPQILPTASEWQQARMALTTLANAAGQDRERAHFWRQTAAFLAASLSELRKWHFVTPASGGGLIQDILRRATSVLETYQNELEKERVDHVR